jgi:hypothetical protein
VPVDPGALETCPAAVAANEDRPSAATLDAHVAVKNCPAALMPIAQETVVKLLDDGG